MKALVTGGGGFIGGALVQRLVEQGHTVSSLSRVDYPELRKIGAEVISADLQDVDSVCRAVEGKDIVFHVGAKAGFWGPYKEYFRTNVLGTKNIIKACRKSGVGSLVFTSSASVVFDGADIEGMNEKLPYPEKPLSHYTKTKALAEKAVLEANDHDLKTISLRPHLVWGSGDQHILPRIIQQARAGKLRRIGKGRNLVDTTYIDNAVQAHLCAYKALIDNPMAYGKAYFITDGEPLKLWDLMDDLLTAHGFDPLRKETSQGMAISIAGILEILHKIFAPHKDPRLTRFLVHELTASHWFDISAAKKELGYEPIVSVEEGLARIRYQNP